MTRAIPRVAIAAVLLFGNVARPTMPQSLADSAPTLGWPPQLAATEVTSRHGVVVSGSPDASRAGAAVLSAGGNAVDAAVAAALALGVAEPGQSGLGGQTYMLICRPGAPCVAIDGSCRTPLRISRTVLVRLAALGRLHGHEWAATPGTLSALAFALDKYGTMPLTEVLGPVIDLADSGATWTPNQLHFLTAYVGKVRDHPYLADLVLHDGLFPWPLTHRYCNDDLALTLRRIAAGGARDFYRGEIAGEIEADMRAHGGFIRGDDLASMSPVEHEPYRGSYRGIDVVSFPAPGAGAAVILALETLARFPSARLARTTADALHLQVEATRLGIAAARSLRPADWLQPGSIAAIAADRAGRILAERALAPDELGGDRALPWLDRDTTHVSVAARDGTVVSLTQTLGQGFGTCVATPGLGFPLNSMTAGFDLDHPESDLYLAPRRAAQTGMAPTILLRDGRPFLVLGGVGTARITSSIVLTVVNLVDRGMSLAEAVGAPRALWGSAPENTLTIELGGWLTEATADDMRRLGHPTVQVRRFPLTQGDLGWQGGVNAIEIREDGLRVGVGDPRRQGAAAVDSPP